MKRFFAVVGIVAFLAACSDSNMAGPVSQPHAVSRDVGDPPPPPLSGDGSGELFLGGDASTQAAASTNSLLSCSGPNFSLTYVFSYLQPDPNNNQVVHLQLNGSLSGEIILHQNQNGKSNAQGNISDGSFSFNLQTGDVNTLTSSEFDFFVTGILTNLSTGFKCQASGDLSGSLAVPID